MVRYSEMLQIRRLQQEWCHLTSGLWQWTVQPSTLSLRLFVWISNGISIYCVKCGCGCFTDLFKTFRLQTVWLSIVQTFNQFMSSFGQMRKPKWSNDTLYATSIELVRMCRMPWVHVCRVYDYNEFRYLSDCSCYWSVLNKIALKKPGMKTGTILLYTQQWIHWIQNTKNTGNYSFGEMKVFDAI